MFGCKYGPARSRACTGARPNQHTVKMNCPVMVRFSCSGSDTSRKNCHITQFIDKHNHPMSREMYRQDTQVIVEDDEESLLDMMKSNMKIRQIANIFKRKTCKTFNYRHLQYKIKKMKVDDKDEEDFAQLLGSLEAEGGNVDVLLNYDGTVRVLVIVTSEMKKALLSSNPSILQCDTTFKIESSGYKLSGLLYLNPVTGKGEIAQLAFMSDEAAEAYKFVFSSFKKMLFHNPKVVMVDKDFAELKALKEVFPTTITLLCWFHVIKWWRNLLKTARVEDEVRDELEETFVKLVYARSKEEFSIICDTFLKLAKVN